MGIRIGECKAENQCLETENEKLETQNEKFDALNEKLETLNEKFEGINEKLQVEYILKKKIKPTYFKALISNVNTSESLSCVFEIDGDGNIYKYKKLTTTTKDVPITVWGSSRCTLRILAIGGGGGGE